MRKSSEVAMQWKAEELNKPYKVIKSHTASPLPGRRRHSPDPLPLASRRHTDGGLPDRAGSTVHPYPALGPRAQNPRLASSGISRPRPHAHARRNSTRGYHRFFALALLAELIQIQFLFR